MHFGVSSIHTSGDVDVVVDVGVVVVVVVVVGVVVVFDVVLVVHNVATETVGCCPEV